MSHESNSTIFDRDRTFQTNKEKGALGEKGAVNRITADIGDFSQFQPAAQPEYSKMRS
ncbi:MAG TPA: hypothetical protein VKA95_03130 [Nitrososphaeraceae archaeon]|nr:hypothetical protein [Nitrososphaeraceae archaeon]